MFSCQIDAKKTTTPFLPSVVLHGISKWERGNPIKNVEHLSQLTNNITLHIVVYQKQFIRQWNHNCKNIFLMYQHLFLIDQMLRSKPLKVKTHHNNDAEKINKNLTNIITLCLVVSFEHIICCIRNNFKGDLLMYQTMLFVY